MGSDPALAEDFHQLPECRVTWPGDPGSFYLRIRHPASEAKLHKLEQALCTCYDNSEADVLDWAKGDLCAVQTVSDLRWWRARLLSVVAAQSGSRSCVLVNLQILDSGIVLHNVSTAQLRPLASELHPHNWSVRAIQCHVLGMRPAGGAKWTVTAAEKMNSLFDKVHSCVFVFIHSAIF